MSINGIVKGVYFGENGEHAIALEGDERGQPRLFFNDPHPNDVDLLVGHQIWGSANNIMLGETEIAKRESYTIIRFVVDSVGAVIDKERERRFRVTHWTENPDMSQQYPEPCQHIWNAHGQCQWCHRDRKGIDYEDGMRDARDLLMRVSPEVMPIESLSGLISQLSNYIAGLKVEKHYEPTR